jgi:hypothetical protein
LISFSSEVKRAKPVPFLLSDVEIAFGVDRKSAGFVTAIPKPSHRGRQG